VNLFFVEVDEVDAAAGLGGATSDAVGEVVHVGRHVHNPPLI
jgi:hypothetical protein